MKTYILKIVGAALISAFSEYLVPKDWQKYIKLISGFIIISVLISPFTSKHNMPDIFEDFPLNSDYSETGKTLLFDKVKKELELKIEEDIILRVNEEFSQDIKANVFVNSNSEGKIESVKKIELIGTKNEKITERLKFIYGTDEVIWIE